MNVKNANGILEPLDIKKIQEKTKSAEIGLENVFAAEVEVDSQIQFYDGITTDEITESLIKTAVGKIDIDKPNYTFFAARLFLKQLAHKVGRTIGGIKGNAYSPLSTYLEFGEKEGKIIIGLKDKYDLNKLDRSIEPKRDLLFTYLGIKTFYDRYILKTKDGEPFEMPQHLFMAVSMFIAQNEMNPLSMDKKAREEYSSLNLNEKDQKIFIRTYWAIKFYDMLSKFEVMAATPTLSNARTPRHQCSSCFVKGTKVRTIEGEKDIDKIKEGDLVLTHKNRFMEVYELFVRDYAKNLITLNINGLIKNLSATEEHPVLSIKKEDIKCIRKLGSCLISQGNNKRCFKMKGEYKKDCELLEKEFKSSWRKIDDLKEGDFVSISFPKNIKDKTIFISDFVQTKNLIEIDGKLSFKRSSGSFYSTERSFLNNLISPVNNKIEITTDFMKLVGYFLAEGYISKEKKFISFTFGSKEINYIEETKMLLENIFGVEAIVTVNKDNSTNVIVYSKIIALFFDYLTGTGFDKKELCKELLFADPKTQEGLLIGVIRGDGCALKEGYQLTMSNEKLITQLFEISLRCGLSPYMKKDAKKHKLATIKASHLKIGAKEDKEFIISVGKNIKNINLNPEKSSTLRHFWFNEEYFMKIINREDNYIEEKVYNIEVKEDHSYSVSGVNVHNCYIGSTPDSIEGIFDTYKEQSLLSKFGGGIGWDWMQVRGSSSSIDGTKNAAGGIIPFLKIDNDVALAVDQLGTRKGAIAVYVEPWHIDIYDFLSLKKNSGEERRRAHDLFPALWLNDLFMERIEKDEDWTLFSPETVPGLTETYGKEFKELYEKYEKDTSIPKKTVKAKDIWKEALRQYFETGNPFLTFKDRANEVNPNKHVGIIRSSNLCTEIFQNTAPNKYLIKVEYEDGSIDTFDEYKEIETDEGDKKLAKKISSIDTIKGKKVFFVGKKTIEGDTAVCNLASLNLSKINTKEEMERIIPIGTRFLDNVIDLNFYPHRKTKITNLKSRAIGFGVMGEAQMLAESKIMFGTQEHYDKIDEIMEMFSYNVIKSSSELGKEKGSYPDFKGSEWSKGIFPKDNAKEEVNKLTSRKLIYDWDKLAIETKKYMRNGYLMAVAPTSSISILTGTTQAIEPVFKRFWKEENLSGVIPVVAPNLSPDTWQYYVPAFELDQEKLVTAGAIRQKWLDQGQSLNIFITLDTITGKKLHQIYMKAWKYGLKSTYYLRSQSPKAMEEEDDVEDRSQECFGCQ